MAGPEIADPLIIAAVAALAVEAQVLRNGFAWDDTYFTGPGVPRGGLLDAITSSFWDGSSYLSSDVLGYFRPLTSAALWLGRAVSDAPWALHGISLAAAILAATAFALLARRILGAGPGSARAAGWLGILFLAHPLGAEVLCLSSNVSDHLALGFLCVGLAALVDHGESGGAWRLAAASAAGFLACAAKEVGVVFALTPLATWLLARAAGRGAPPRSLARPWPWIAAIVPVAAYLALRAAALPSDPGPAVDLPTLAAAFGLAPGQALLRAIVPLPRGTAVPISAADPVAFGAAIAAWTGVAALVARDVMKRRGPSLPTLGAAFALALLVPSLAAVAEVDGVRDLPTRYLHLPLAGLLLAAAPAIASRRGLAADVALLAALGLLAMLSWVRIGEWRSDVSFSAAELSYRPGSDVARVNLAQALCQADAFDAAEETLAPLAAPGTRFSSPLAHAAYLNAVAKVALLRDRDPERASRALEEALRITPADLACVLMLAEARDRAGRPDQSLAIVERALAAPWFRDSRRALIERHRERWARRAADAAPRR